MLAQPPAGLHRSRAATLPLLRRLPPRARRLAIIVFDIATAYASFPIALLLRDGELRFGDPARAVAADWFPLLLPIFLAIATSQRMHSGLWRFASTRDL